MQPLISFENLSKRFGRNTALDGVSLDIGEGEIFGLTGPNGAGKTTLVRILCSALRPDEGAVVVNGLDVRSNELRVKRMIGYLPEEPNLYERLSARRFLDFFSELYEVENKEERIDKVLGEVGLLERADDRISTFSKGMRHRLSLARALVHDPRILVLDEPTMGLDPTVAMRTRELIGGMKGAKTVLLCTHYMEEAEALCDRMTILNSGKVAIVETPMGIRDQAAAELGRRVSLDESFVHFTR